jgi:hypothetical protein
MKNRFANRNLESHAYLLVICYFERSQCLFCSFRQNKRFAQTNDQKIARHAIPNYKLRLKNPPPHTNQRQIVKEKKQFAVCVGIAVVFQP